MLKVDYHLSRHPKILAAGALLGGPGGAGRALALYIDGLSYAVAYNTNGKVHDQFVASSPLVDMATEVAKILADPRIRLWKRVRHGYLIHDFHDFNKSSSEINTFREKRRLQKRKERERVAIDVAKRHDNPSPMLSPDYSRARDHLTHNPVRSDSVDFQQQAVPVRTLTAADASGFAHAVENSETGDVETDLRDCETSSRPRPTNDVRRLDRKSQSRNRPTRENVSDESQPVAIGDHGERNRSR